MDTRAETASRKRRVFRLELVLWADTVSVQNEKDAILDPSVVLPTLQNYSCKAPTWLAAVCSYTQEITLHYVVVDQEKEMEYRHWLRSFSNFFFGTFNFTILISYNNLGCLFRNNLKSAAWLYFQIKYATNCCIDSVNSQYILLLFKPLNSNALKKYILRYC